MIAEKFNNLKNDASDWLDIWQSVADEFTIMPIAINKDASVRKTLSRNILDNTALVSINAMVAGLQTGITPVSKKWFKFDIGQTITSNSRKISKFEDFVDKVISNSNFYSVVSELYRDIVLYGNACCLVRDDDNELFRLERLQIGSYFIDYNHYGQAVHLVRKIRIKSKEAKELFKSIDAPEHAKIDIYHSIEQDKKGAWVSKYEYDGKTIEEYKYDYKPFLFVRWSTERGADYSVSPAMNALGDARQLQTEQMRKAMAIDYQTDPPVQIPVSMRNNEINLQPGGVSFYHNDNEVVRPASVVNFQIQYLLQDIEDVRSRIRSAFFHDIFIMIGSLDHTGMTATEIAERRAEKMIVIGSILDRMQDDFIEPFIGTLVKLIAAVAQKGFIPIEVPQSMLEDAYSVIPISSMYQSRIESDNININKFVSQVSVLAQIKPDVMRRINFDEVVDAIARNSGVDSSLLKTSDEVAEEVASEQAAAIAQQLQQVSAADVVNPYAQINAIGQTPYE